MDPSAQMALTDRLLDGEQLLWAERPPEGLLLRGSDAFAIPFSLLWCGFAIFWEYGVITGEAPLLFRLWGVPFVAVGLYMVLGRFAVDAWQRAQTSYGVTDRRVLILTGTKLTSLNLRTLSDVSLHEKSGGSGFITLGATKMRNPSIAGWPGQQGPPRLELTAHVRQAFDILTTAQQSA
ncbi:MAG: hypothetical protein K8J08_05575 [Thermoanaerobaculia bacterium]|nr:hypothetical protein [Thermoanaerobaculia bacterium]